MSKEEFFLSENEKFQLIEIARSTIRSYILTGQVSLIDKAKLSKSLLMECGCFVSLHKKGSLRGCIGRFTSNDSLYEIVQKMAISSATQDNRFPNVELDELDEIEIEISVLTPLIKIISIDEITMGKHGIYIRKGSLSGTFLPQVAIETGWTKEEFLGHCSKNKVGIGWNGWKDAEIFIFEALVFSEK
jgi:hypothetical protein